MQGGKKSRHFQLIRHQQIFQTEIFDLIKSDVPWGQSRPEHRWATVKAALTPENQKWLSWTSFWTALCWASPRWILIGHSWWCLEKDLHEGKKKRKRLKGWGRSSCLYYGGSRKSSKIAKGVRKGGWVMQDLQWPLPSTTWCFFNHTWPQGLQKGS